jgi:hypothetical protein
LSPANSMQPSPVACDQTNSAVFVDHLLIKPDRSLSSGRRRREKS